MPRTKHNGHSVAAPQVTLILNALLSRSALYQQLLDMNGRDLDAECGYPITITIDQYRKLYDRLGIAKRVVGCMPEECWAVEPEIYEQEDPQETAFEKAWKDAVAQWNFYHYLHRLDEMSGIGQFGILLFGLDDGQELSQPVEGVNEDEEPGGTEKELLFLRVFDESAVQISAREIDTKNSRYAQPTLYNVNFQDVNVGGQQATEIITRQVHWTRVLHVADGRVSSEVFGTPRMQDVFNHLLDIRKTLGPSAEMFWKGAFPGYSFEINPELADQGVEIDSTAVREEFQNYMNGLQRYLALSGLQTKLLSPQVTDPTGHIDAQLKAIAIAKSIPFRILFGSEQAQLAASQDARAWGKRVRRRQEDYLTPMVLRPFVKRLIAYGVLPEPEQVLIDWPDVTGPSDADKASVGMQRTQALAAYVTGGVDQLVPPDSYLTTVLGMEQAEVDAILERPEPEAGEEGAVMPQFEQPQAGASGEQPVSPTSAFNGAQVQAAAQIVKDVTAGVLPRESGIGQLIVFFKLTPEEAEQVMGTAGTKEKVEPNPGAPEERGKSSVEKGGPQRPFPVGPVVHFDPSQPREPAGTPEGGQFASTEGRRERKEEPPPEKEPSQT